MPDIDFDGLFRVEVDVALWKGDRNIRFAEQAVDGKTQITFNPKRLHYRSHLEPEVHFEIQRVIAKLLEEKISKRSKR